MKRLFPTSLGLLLVVGTCAHLFAATLCPRGLGGVCCFAKIHKHTSLSKNMAMHDMHMDGMSMDGMNMDDMAMHAASMDHMAMNDMSMDGMNMDDMPMDAASMDHMAVNDMAIEGDIVDISSTFPPASLSGEVVANTCGQPVESCAHCFGHSGNQNVPVSSLSVSDQSNRDLGSVPLPVSRFLARPAMTLARIGLPRDHAPPGSSAPRYILVHVFLI